MLPAKQNPRDAAAQCLYSDSFEILNSTQDARALAAQPLIRIDATREYPIHQAAVGKWLFQLHPFGQVFWSQFWQLLFWLCIVGALGCGVGLLMVSAHLFEAGAPGARFLASLRVWHSLADIVLLIGLIAMILGAFGTRRPIVRYSLNANRGFFLEANFDKHEITSATDFDGNPLNPRPIHDKSIEINEHPSAIQNLLPRLYDLQEVGGRIKLRVDELGSTYFFESCRWLLGDTFVMVAGFIPAIILLVAYVTGYLTLSLGWNIISLLALLLGMGGVLHKQLQRWVARSVLVIISFEEGPIAKLLWFQYLGIGRGIHSDLIYLDEVDALGEFCKRLLALSKKGEHFKLSPLPLDEQVRA